MAMSSIIVFEEKDSEQYFDASTEELLIGALLTVLRQRIKLGYFYKEPTKPVLSQKDQDNIAIPEETVKVLPESMQLEISRSKRRSLGLTRDYDEKMLFWNNLQHVIAVDDETAATFVHEWSYTRSDGVVVNKSENLVEWLMDQHADYQYEGYKIVDVRSADFSSKK